MGNVSENALLFGSISMIIYFVILFFGARKALKENRIHNAYFLQIRSVTEVIEEVRSLILEEENIMVEEKSLENNLTLSDLLTQKATEENYKEVIDLLAKLAEDTYKDYKFLIAKSPDEHKDANFLQIVSNWAEDPKAHKEIFSKAISYGIDMQVLRKKFADKLAQGGVLPLGDDIVVITEDGSRQLPTGVSNINSGLEGGEIAFIVSFVHKDNYEEWKKNNLPKENVDG